MRKIITSIVVLVVLVAGAVIVAPSFIDWNQYKGMASDKVRELTGRELAINGSVSIAIWPAPALVAEDITFSNMKGGKAPEMASLKAVEVRIALAPLFAGRVLVETVKLIEPLIELERLADGRANWEFSTAAKASGGGANTGSGNASSQDGGGAPAIALDNFAIEKGTLIFRDAQAGTTETVTGINATIAAASLQGPMESSGGLVLRGIPITYSASVGKLIQERTVPVNARVTLDAGNLTAQIGGTVVNIVDAPQFKGSVKVTGKDLGAVMQGLGGGSPFQGAVVPVGLNGQLAASAKSVDVKDLTVNLADIQAKGDIRLDLGEAPRFDSRLSVNRIDVDKLRAKFGAKAKPAAAAKPAAGGEAAEKQQPAAVDAGKPVRFDMPTDIAGAVILTVDAIGYGSGVVRDLAVNAELANGVLKLSQFSAQFPGGSDLSVAGALATPKSVPTLTANVESTVNDLRGVLSWLEVSPPPVPADRLRKINVKTQVTATPELIQVAGLDARFDGSRLEGGVSVALRERLGFGAALVLDSIDVDAYMPRSEKQQPAAKPSASGGNSGTASGSQNAGGRQDNPLAALAALNAFDANFDIHVKSAVYGGAPLKDLVAEGTLYNGALDLKRLSIGRLAGASANITGRLEGLSAVPAAKALRITANVPDAGAVARLTGAELPLSAKALGKISVKSRLDGSLLAPTVDAALGVAGGNVNYKGRVSAMSIDDLLNGRLAVKHPDLVGLLGRLGIAYKPKGKLGALDIAANVKGGTQAVNLTDIKGAIGKTTIGGAVAAALAGDKPKVTANLRTGALDIESFMPAQKNAAFTPGAPAMMPAALRGPSAGAPSPLMHLAARGHWPTTPLDLSALNALDADVTLAAPIIIYGRYLAEKADIGASLKGGVLDVTRLTASLFGGALNGKLRAAANGNQIGASATVKGLNVEEALRAVTGEAAANGNMDVGFDITGAGPSVAAIVSSLGGNANFQLSGMDVREAASGSLLSGLLGLFTSLNQLGGGNTNDAASVGANFTVQRGIATTRDLTLASAFGNGGAAGSIDLPNWTIDLKGEVKLAESMLIRLLKAKVRETRNAVPFAITGSLEAPNVKVDTGAALGAGVPIPGADALLNKAPKGVGNIIKGILGGGTSQKAPADNSGSQQQQQPQQQEQQQQPVTPERLLKDLFKRL